MRILKTLTPILFVLSLAGFTIGGGYAGPMMGNEIPWPLSSQRVVTVKHSQGLWEIANKDRVKYLNVEIESNDDSEFDFIRVVELDPQNYQVVSWGEGFFKKKSIAYQTNSSFSAITFQPGGGQSDKYGRYIHMYPNGDLYTAPYLIRVVEVKTSVGHVLGLSVINSLQKSTEHFLGQRISSKPLICHTSDLVDSGLVCDF